MKVSKNMIVTDTVPGPGWNFDSILAELTGERWTASHGGLKYKLSGRKEKIRRYINFLIFPFRLFLHRNEIDNLIALQQYYGIFYAFYCLLFHVKKKNYCMGMTFIYNRRKGAAGALQYRFIKKIINSKYLDCIVVYSEYEKKYYEKLFGVPAGKLLSCRLGLEDLTGGIKRKKTEPYILSAGRSNRDYEFLFRALRGHPYEVKIVCDSIDRKTEENFTVYKNTYYEDFFQMIAECFCVVIALKDKRISSGQLVILQAKQFAKPVIVTESRAVEEYIKDGVDGFIIRKSEGELVEKICMLSEDPILYRRMCEASRKSYENSFSLYALGEQIVNCLKKTGRLYDENTR